MALINITNVKIEKNPAPFQSPVELNITFECLKDLEEEIQWKLIYIGSAKDEKFDQVLDDFQMGPLNTGVMQFTLESQPPDYHKIPTKEDLLGITAIILAVSYKNQEFFRVGYYVYNNYTNPEYIENDPEEIIIEDIQRSILADKPRITRFPINWTGEVKAEDVKQDNQSYMFGEGQQDQNENKEAYFSINSVFQN